MTKYVICRGVANVFATQCDFTTINQPELETQLLLNQPVEVLESASGFYRIKMHDTYTGWVKQSDVCESPDNTNLLPYLVTSLFTTVHKEADVDSEVLMRVSLGTVMAARQLKGRSKAAKMLLTVLPDGRTGFIDKSHCQKVHELFAGETVADASEFANRAAAHAMKLVGTPYLWGGSSAAGIDCSGLVQLAFRMQGLTMLRNASMQINDERFTRLPETNFEDGLFQAGDLLFFRSLTSARITHVGIALGDDRFVHASPYSGESYVVIEKRKGNRYAKRFAVACRLRDCVMMKVA